VELTRDGGVDIRRVDLVEVDNDFLLIKQALPIVARKGQVT
jgi:hypothetical protein